ncbi:hypothetical protein [Pedobacter caeni]|uniref:Uncharacterized protein n=1 Tax=Pedobacter caeni TaxID=288992 RepID=A0A1M5GU32_9SPHI|nr:hypothetical protein [Pedobacter caeni]SHG07197.1 hypothetical protein SAMN04488522_104367 [Pedobacter caeni]
MNEQTHRYSGLVSQEEFNMRFGFSKSRIALGYTQEEVSFLMGKHPYFYCEYEEMNGCNISDQDKVLLSAIYKAPFSAPLNFEPDDYGFKQKRLIKGARIFNDGIYCHTLTHPWQIIIDKEKRIKENKPIKFKELPFRIEQHQQVDAISEFRAILTDLLDCSFLRSPRHPLNIYEQIRLNYFNPILRPRFLKQVIYELMAKNILQMRTIENKIHYSVHS